MQSRNAIYSNLGCSPKIHLSSATMLNNDRDKIRKLQKMMKTQKENSGKALQSYILRPNDSSVLCWDIFVLGVVLYSCISTPIEVVFHRHTLDWPVTEPLIFLVLFANIIVNLNTAVYIDNILCDQRHVILSTYLKSWLIFDLF